MGQYTILMNHPTKQLIATHKISLRQHENLVDKLVFIVPFQYNDEIDLREFNCVIEWLDPTNVAHVDLLVKDEEVYKENYQRYFLDVTSPLNRYAGDIEVKLVFTWQDDETKKRYKLESDTTIIPIETVKDYYAVMPDESFDAINDKIDELRSLAEQMNASAELYEKTKADNLTLDQTTNELQLTSMGEKIGSPVILDLIDEADKALDELDKNPNDGVIDLDDIDWETVNL